MNKLVYFVIAKDTQKNSFNLNKLVYFVLSYPNNIFGYQMSLFVKNE